MTTMQHPTTGALVEAHVLADELLGRIVVPLDSSIEEDIGSDLVRLCYVWPDLPWTVNAEARTTTRHGAMRYATLAKEWKEHYRKMAVGSPPLAWCDVIVIHEKRTRGLPDTGSCYMTYKAGLDGIKAAGVLEDDDPRFVRDVLLRAPIFTGRDALAIILVGPRSPR